MVKRTPPEDEEVIVDVGQGEAGGLIASERSLREDSDYLPDCCRSGCELGMGEGRADDNPSPLEIAPTQTNPITTIGWNEVVAVLVPTDPVDRSILGIGLDVDQRMVAIHPEEMDEPELFVDLSELTWAITLRGCDFHVITLSRYAKTNVKNIIANCAPNKNIRQYLNNQLV